VPELLADARGEGEWAAVVVRLAPRGVDHRPGEVAKDLEQDFRRERAQCRSHMVDCWSGGEKSELGMGWKLDWAADFGRG
jgi:hypothetical protein